LIEFALYGLLSALVAFALVPLVLYGLGARLPRAHVAKRSVHVPASRDRVFALIADVAAHPRWRKRIGRVQIVAREPRLRLIERGKDGTIELEVEESCPPERFVLRTVPVRRAIFAGTWTFALQGEDGGTRVTLEEQGEIGSPIARLFARYVLGHGANVERTLADLRSHFGKG
jgi:hypothetical protein